MSDTSASGASVAPPPPGTPRIQVGIFGGSGFYSLLDDAREVKVDTPYGPPSAPVVVGEVGGRSVGFMPRHGPNHELPPHRINYRANLWAMKHLGATDVILPCAAGSLQKHVEPGHFVIADQVVDRTSGREDTYYDGPETTHVSFAEPYDAEMREVAIRTAREQGIGIHERGTVVVIQGPRFSSKAESRWFSSMGWEVINMTQYPEVILARELEMAALNISLITDYDVGLSDDPSIAEVSHAAVVEVFQKNNEALRELLFGIVPALPLSADRPALHALEGARV
jgi:5'-methylthioadenosine phosphorylase